MSIKLTEAAASEVMKFIEDGNSDSEKSYYLRIAIAGGGCSGFEYKLTVDSEYDEGNYTIYEQHGVKTIVDRKSALFLDGTTLDYYSDISKRGFVFDNPNAVKSCGCGSSFQV